MVVLNINFAGRSFKFGDAGGKDLVAKGMTDGTFEAPLPAMLMEMLSRIRGGFVDVGANSGLYTILAGITRPDVQIIAFEPFPAAAQECITNVSLNNLQSRVEMRKVALSDKSGSASLYIPDQSHGVLESSCSLEKEFKGGDQTTIEVTVHTLDQLRLIQPIAVIKADIEGHEHAFLRGATETIRKFRPVIFVEVLPAANMQSLQQFLMDHNYLDFRMQPDRIIRDNEVRFDPQGWNHAFIPAEMVHVFEAACSTLGLELLETGVKDQVF